MQAHLLPYVPYFKRSAWQLFQKAGKCSFSPVTRKSAGGINLLFAFILFLFSAASLLAQPAIQWDKTFGGTANDQLFKVLQTTDGGYLLAGTSDSIANGNKTEAGSGKVDFWIVKISANGAKEWDKTFGGTGWDRLTDAQQTSDGGYILGGSSNSNAGGDKSESNTKYFDYWIIKLDAKGTKQWDKTFGLAGSEFLKTVRQTPDGGYILAGTAYSNLEVDYGEENQYFMDWTSWLVKLDASGAMQWDRMDEKRSNSALTNLELTLDGGYVIGLAEGTGDQIHWQYFILTLTATGEVKRGNGYGEENAYNRLQVVQQTRDGGYILAGWSSTDDAYGTKAYLVKADKDGNKQWTRTIGNIEAFADNITSVSQSLDGGYLICGHSAGNKGLDKSENSRGGQDFWIVKLQADGNILWDKTIGGSDHDYLQSSIQTTDGGYMLGGYSKSPVSGEKTQNSKDEQNEYDFWVVKLAPEVLVQPGTITSFTVRKEAANAVLEWTSYKGSTIVGQFEVQQSLDRKTWKKVAAVNAGQASDNYTYVHTSPVIGIEVQYRLKITGLDKNVTYSRTRSLSIAQNAPKVLWDKVIENYKFQSMLHTPDGGYILAGTRGDNWVDSRGGADYWIVKLAADGTKEWNKAFGGPDDDHLNSIIQTADGGYLLGGSSRSKAGGDKTENSRSIKQPDELFPYDYWVVKINADGTKQWDKTIGGDNVDDLRSLQQTPDGNYILEGASNSKSGGDKSPFPNSDIYYYRVWEVKLDARGKKISDKIIASINYDTSYYSLVRTSDNGYFFHYDEYNIAYGRHSFVKFSPDGSTEWTKTLTFPEATTALITMQQTTDNGYMLALESRADTITDVKSENSRGGYDYWILKLAADGSIEWEKTIGGNRSDRLFTAKQTPDGGYILGGESISEQQWDKTEDVRMNSDVWIVKLAKDGTKEWDKTIGGDSRDQIFFIQPTADGGYAFGGTTYSQPGYDRISPLISIDNFWIVKLGFETPPLPVTLTRFSAEKEKNTALLSWTTGTETRSDHFELQHSINGKTWNTIARVNARGESRDSVDYSYIHANPVLGTENLYRLKMVDTDKSYTFSRINTLTFEADASLIMFPNPVSETLTIQITDPTSVKNIQLLNSSSVPVYNSGSNPAFQLDVSKLTPGLHFVKITRTDNSFLIQKVVIAR